MSGILNITGQQIIAARTLVGLTQAELAAKSKVSIPTIARMESRDGQVSGVTKNILAVRRALEDAGIEFIAADAGPWVRLKQAR